MHNNDKKIAEFRTNVENKRNALGPQPSIRYVTNGVIPMPDNSSCNLNLLSSEHSCVDVLSQVLSAVSSYERANTLLGTSVVVKLGQYTLEQWITDIKQVLTLIQWKNGKRKLDELDAQLKALMSEDAKTANALDMIEQQLNTHE